MEKLKGIRNERGGLTLPRDNENLEDVCDFNDGYNFAEILQIFKSFSEKHNIPIEDIRLVPFSNYDERYGETNHWVEIFGIDEETDEEMNYRLERKKVLDDLEAEMEAKRLARDKQEYERLKAIFEKTD